MRTLPTTDTESTEQVNEFVTSTHYADSTSPLDVSGKYLTSIEFGTSLHSLQHFYFARKSMLYSPLISVRFVLLAHHWGTATPSSQDEICKYMNMVQFLHSPLSRTPASAGYGPLWRLCWYIRQSPKWHRLKVLLHEGFLAWHKWFVYVYKCAFRERDADATTTNRYRFYSCSMLFCSFWWTLKHRDRARYEVISERSPIFDGHPYGVRFHRTIGDGTWTLW